MTNAFAAAFFSFNGFKHHLPQVHHRSVRFGLGLDGQGVGAGLQLDGADVAFDKVLEMAGVFDGHFQRLLSDDEVDFRPAVPFAAALQR